MLPWATVSEHEAEDRATFHPGRSLRALGVYVILTVLLTWPLAVNLHVMDAGDSAFFAWEIGWEVHALKTDPASLPHANIFHPMRYTLGMDEPVLGTTLLVLPLALFTDDAVLLYHVARLLTWILSGLTAYWLAREMGCREAFALLGGALFAFSPIRTDQVAHLSTLGTQWLPLVLLFVIRWSRAGRLRDALLAAGSFVLAFLACGYHGLIAVAVLPPFVLVLLAGRLRRLPALVGAFALAGLALLPVYLMHNAALGPEQYVRGKDETVYYSAGLEAFVATSSWNRIWGEATAPMRRVGPNNLFPGLVPVVLVFAGLVLVLRRGRGASREVWALAAMAAAAVLVCLGPEIRAGDRVLAPGPFGLLRDLVPIFQSIRVTSRGGALLALPLAVLAVRAMQALMLPKVAGLLLGGAALLETLIVPIPVPRWAKIIDSRLPPPGVYQWLADQPGQFAVVHLPMLDVYGLERRPAFHESVYMVYSTLHWKRLVNGYAGIEPRAYQRLRTLAHAFPNVEFLDRLQADGVRYVIVHRRGYGPLQWPRLESALPAFADRLRLVTELDGDRVYALTK